VNGGGHLVMGIGNGCALISGADRTIILLENLKVALVDRCSMHL